MRPSREIDARVAQEIFGYQVVTHNNVLHESAEKGIRPLPDYSQSMEWAWTVADKMRVSMIPVEDGNWFAFVGPQKGWSSPEAFLEFLRTGDFAECGAAVGRSPAMVICEAALVANQKQQASEGLTAQSTTEAKEISASQKAEKDNSLH
jgi:hypothetical protein